MLLAEDGRARQVEQRVGTAQDREQLAARHAEHVALGGNVGPAHRLREEPERAGDVADRVARLGRDLVALGIVGPVAGVLDVVHLAAEATQALDVVQDLPGHAGEWGAAHHPQDDDSRCAHRSPAVRVSTAPATRRAKWPPGPPRMKYSVPRKRAARSSGSSASRCPGPSWVRCRRRARSLASTKGATSITVSIEPAGTPKAAGSRPHRSAARPRAAISAASSGILPAGQVAS